MLILTRKPGERVVVIVDGKRITVQCLKDKNNRLVLGFDAPRDVQIVREEIMRESLDENVVEN